MNTKHCIAILLGCLMTLTIGHNIIPHHHHLDDVFSHEGCHPLDRSQSSGITDDPSWHCHAFNGIEFIPTQKRSSSVEPGKTNLQDLIPACPDERGKSTPLVYRSGDGEIWQFYKGYFGNSFGLRAPPSA